MGIQRKDTCMLASNIPHVTVKTKYRERGHVHAVQGLGFRICMYVCMVYMYAMYICVYVPFIQYVVSTYASLTYLRFFPVLSSKASSVRLH